MNSLTFYRQTIPHLDALISNRHYDTAKKFISQISAGETFTRDQLIELFIRAALVRNKRKEPEKGESLARKGYNRVLSKFNF